jgi:phospholipid/cholesterol/gamma-HCH transport system substrate-binding protein
MRSRSIREGTVGLLLMLGLALFAGLILWLRGVTLGQRSYKLILEFANIAGMQVGTPVRYRGVPVGKITQTRPGPNGVEVEVEISPTDLIIPRDVIVEANQSGLLGSTSIDILPKTELQGTVNAKPLDRDCDRTLIICNQARLQGKIGVSVDELIRASIRFADVYSQPEFFNNVNTLAKNSAAAAAEVTALTREFREVTRVARLQLGSFSTTADSFRVTAGKLGLTADQVNSLIATNRGSLVDTLGNINLITRDLRTTVYKLGPVVDRVQQGELLRNLETLSVNAAQASANFRDISNSLNNPTNLVVLQQTLDSARSTFQNAQKITADLEELTSDPVLRENLRNLINGLNRLVSTTQDLQQQAQLAQALPPLAAAVEEKPSTLQKPSAAPESPQASKDQTKSAKDAPETKTKTIDLLKEKPHKAWEIKFR